MCSGRSRIALDSRLKLAVSAGAIALDAIPLTAKWKGITGDEIGLRVDGLTQGIAINLTAMTAGAGTPDVNIAVANFQLFYTDVVNQFSHSGALDQLEVQNRRDWSWPEPRPIQARA